MTPAFCNSKYLFVVIAWLTAAIPTNASVIIYDTFGPGGVVTDPPNWVANAAGSRFSSTNMVIGTAFVPSEDFFFDSLEIPLGGLQGLNSFEVSLLEDFVVPVSGWPIPGDPLELFTVVDPLVPLGTGVMPTVVHVPSVAHPLLQAGARYWVLIRMTDPSASVYWNASSYGASAPWAYSDDRFLPGFSLDANAYYAQVLRVYGTPATVPEPASALLLSGGVLALLILTRRRASGKA